MRVLSWTLVLSLLGIDIVTALRPTKRYYHTHDYYVLEHDLSGVPLAEVANALDVEIVEQAGELQNHWLVRSEKSPQTLEARDVELSFDRVLQTLEHIRAQDSQLSTRSSEPNLSSSIKYLAKQTLRQRIKRAPPPVRPGEGEASAAQVIAQRLGINDPLFPQQWHLVNEEFPEHMMNATPIWDMGITGKGIISAMVDDGVDYESEDLKDNFDAVNSYDFNDHEPLPTPKLSDDHHGTRCAGQIAAGRNNFCGVGIAYDSKIAGVRILSGPITDVDEAAALNYGFQNTSIYSCSWGPPDNGKAMEGPSHLIQKAVVNGINRGRGGKGSIFVFASGNGAAYGDQCNFDGYTNSIYSVTVSAIDYKGMHPYYSEPCAANMIVAYSSGGGKQIVTTDKGKEACSSSHGGTSAAAPNAAGVFALALQARPDLTWRDIQYLCINNARMVNPDDPDWEKTASGRLYSYKYGYGALDASRYIAAAKEWNLVKPQSWFETNAIQLNNGYMNTSGEMQGGEAIPPGGLTSKMTITRDMLEENNFEDLEHIRIRVWIRHTRRGDVEIEITSPTGIKSILAGQREHDDDPDGYMGWTFMSVKHWGENPVGDWTIHVSDIQTEGHSGFFLGWNMMFWGSSIDASKTVLYELPLLDDIFPPLEGPHDTNPTAPSATTKTHTKPTAVLPSDHGEAEGENTKVAFPGATGTQDDTVAPSGGSGDGSAPSATSIPTDDEGWLPGMSNLISSQKWFFGAAGAVIVFAGAMGAFFWRRAARRKRENYSTLPDNEHAMSSLRGDDTGVMPGRGGPRTRELYDAFGEVSEDDEDDADEQTQLRGSHPNDRLRDGIGFHSGFLDDDEPSSARTASVERYRDEPERSPRSPAARSPDAAHGSDGSWEHASR